MVRRPSAKRRTASGTRRRSAGLDPGGEGVGRVVVLHRDGLLQDDGPVVVLRVDEVDRRPGQLHPRFEDGFVNAVSVEALATEGRDQGGVDVHRAAVELAARLERRQEAQEQNQVHVVARRARRGGRR